jgi:superfamily II DNA or RNA helicase
MMISISTHFDRTTLERAEAYVRAGYVLALEPNGRGGLEARVRNEIGTVYQQSISLEAPSARHPKGRVHGICSCPMHANCKHVAAALYALVARSEIGSDHAIPVARPTVPSAVQSWVSRAKALPATISGPARVAGPTARPKDYLPTMRDRLLYVLDTSNTSLRVDICKGSIPAKGGGLNKTMRRYDVLFQLRGGKAPPAFFRTVDLDLLAQLARGRALSGQNSYGYDLPEALQSGSPLGAALLQALCETGRFLAEAQEPESILGWSDNVVSPALGWRLTEHGFQILDFIRPNGSSVGMTRFGGDGFWIDRANREIGRLDAEPSDELRRLVQECPPMRHEDLASIAATLPSHLVGFALPTPKIPGAVRRAPRFMHAQLTLSAANAYQRFSQRYGRTTVSLPTLRLRFVYDGQMVDLLDPSDLHRIEGGDLVTLERDRAWEDTCVDSLLAAGALPVEDMEMHAASDRLMTFDYVFADGEFREGSLAPSRLGQALPFVFQTVPKLIAEGWQVDITPQWPFRPETAATQIVVETRGTSGERFAGHGWFDIGFSVEIGGKRHDLAPLIAAFFAQVAIDFDGEAWPDEDALRALLADRPVYIDRGKGRYAPVDLSPIASVLHLFLRHYAQNSRMHPAEAQLAIDAAEALAGSSVRFADHAGIIPLARSLKSLSETSAIAPPRGLVAELRPYQAFGAAWMSSLMAAGFGGVLADDMGLGKTLQVLTLLQARREQTDKPGTALLVVPTSLLHSWQDQAAQFTPQLRLLILHGTHRKALHDQMTSVDLVVTTYALLARDKDILAKVDWDLVIVDEAQVLKNPASQTAKALRDIPTKGRLALTGTPMENSLQDLWTLFDWVVPGLLGDRKTFQAVFRTPIEKQGDRASQARLNRRVRPFLLRRTKAAVATELPPRTEILERVELSKPQQALYEAVRSQMDVRVREAVASKGLAASRITILDALLKLRQVCCDPALVKSEAARGVSDSAKRARLRELLEELVAEGRRVLVFSQFVEMLALIAKDLNGMGIKYLTLTGQTRDRAAVLRDFKEGDAPVFLISLKAGGVGLTLTEADTVILYDPWWNPAVERQAMDRAHRIGQDKPVFVHRLVAAGTVEERILALQAKKQALADALLTEGGDNTATGLLDDSVLADLFSPLKR